MYYSNKTSKHRRAVFSTCRYIVYSNRNVDYETSKFDVSPDYDFRKDVLNLDSTNEMDIEQIEKIKMFGMMGRRGSPCGGIRILLGRELVVKENRTWNKP